MSTEYYLSEQDYADDRPVAFSYWGGRDVGAMVTFDRELPPETPLIDEYRHHLTAGELAARDGRGQGGTILGIGELWGY